LRIVDLRDGVKLRTMSELEQDLDHDEPPASAGGAAEAMDSADPHTWLDPMIASHQAQTICNVLCEIDSTRAERYKQNTTALQSELAAVDAELARTLAPLKGRDLFVYHPAFGYFADRYGFRQIAVEIDGKEPSARQVGELIERARKAGTRVIFVQPQFSSRTAETIAHEIGGSVVPIDDLAADYLENLRRIAAAVRDGLQGKTP
jgi:zinc transport system substrate-binding protein